MNLIKDGFNVNMTNFSQPRVGDRNYAAFANAKFPSQLRFTHN